MTSKVISLAERLAAKQALTAENENLDGELFLLEEGIDLLASYRSIADRATRVRLREAIDAAARGEAPLTPPAANPELPVARATKASLRYKNAAVFVALVIGASAFLEIADPATTDVVAAALKCGPAASLNP